MRVKRGNFQRTKTVNCFYREVILLQWGCALCKSDNILLLGRKGNPLTPRTRGRTSRTRALRASESAVDVLLCRARANK